MGGAQGETLGRQPLVPLPLRQSIWAGPNTHVGGGPTTPMTYYYNSLTPPTVTTQSLQMLRLDRNSLNTVEGSPFVKMSANCDVIGTWRTRT
jgi:hypothetical protein